MLLPQAYVTSLLSTAPVYVNDSEVKSEQLVKDKAILKIGTCSFKFVYAEGVFSPLREENGTLTPIPNKVRIFSTTAIIFTQA